ncbi:MAG: hypothetical protein EA378_10525 [Phycisphaerales bacterium]|nr:MAG: hypothetical protein EA378_10525 [Phycisphaerales bacterium]
MRLAVIIPAAGASSRFRAAPDTNADAADPLADPGAIAGARSKLDEDLGGRPVLHRTIELFTELEPVVAIIVAAPHDPAAFDEFKRRHADKLAILGAKIVPGGQTHRYETVAAALAHVPPNATHVAIHDGARPCTPSDLIERVLEAAALYPAVVPVVELTDTVKRLSPQTREKPADPLAAILGDAGAHASAQDAIRPVLETIPREGLGAVQTPQVFEADLIRRAYTQDNLDSTDDAQLVERLGEEVVAVRGDVRNIKLTHPGDLTIARAILGFKPPSERPTHKRF